MRLEAVRVDDHPLKALSPILPKPCETSLGNEEDSMGPC